MTHHVSYFGLSDQGLVRRRNEDVWAVLPEQHCWIVSDGMGGHLGGDIAAEVTVETVLDYIRHHPISPDAPTVNVEKMVVRAIVAANTAVTQRARTDRSLRGMGATLTLLYLHGGDLVYAHVGDSRIYQLRNRELLRLTEDHSLVTELLESGHISEEEAERFIYKHVVTRAVGTRARVEPDIAYETVEVGDLYLMCSDGLTDLLGDAQIEAMLAQATSLEKGAAALKEHTYERGAPDNVTIVLVQIDD